jgi:hypothetical protein
MNFREYIRMMIHEIFPMADEKENDLTHEQDRGPSEKDHAFGYIILAILIFLLIFLLIN